jgi:2-polyprenyl-3-methyl-5-hydroxy-6-metoxy-1,4-benzoquinol methylase
MSLRMTSRIKDLALRLLGALIGRHAILLPAQAGHDESILDVRGAYRVDGAVLTLEVREPLPGRIRATLLGYEGHFATRRLWTGDWRAYGGPCALTFDLTEGAASAGTVRIWGEEWGRVPLPLPGRRFCWHLEWAGPKRARRQRITGHYLTRAGAIGSEYFEGEAYVDHEAQSGTDQVEIVEILKEHNASGTMLEIGCATGGLLAACDAAGLSAVGIDVSEWAVSRAAERLGPGRAWVCDFEKEDLPPEVAARGPFGAIILAAVLEHFREPFAVLARLTRLAAPGAVLVVVTTNRDSLSHILFGDQWEGHFDWTHKSVERIGAPTLRAELSALGWRIAQMDTHRLWDVSADPTRATLREWWASDARFRRLLYERDLGDLLTCVAIKP